MYRFLEFVHVLFSSATNGENGAAFLFVGPVRYGSLFWKSLSLSADANLMHAGSGRCCKRPSMR